MAFYGVRSSLNQPKFHQDAFQYKVGLSRFRDSYYKIKTILSFIGNSCKEKTEAVYGDGPWLKKY